MALDNFRTIELIWDKANKSIIKTIKTASSDTTGRYLSVKILDGGQEVALNSASLQLYWEHPNFNTSGTDIFEVVNNSGLFMLKFSQAMQSNVGTLDANLVLKLADGTITSDTFEIEVIKGASSGVVIPSNGESAAVQAVYDAMEKLNNFDGGPSIFMNTLSELQTTYPNGAPGVALVRETDPAKIYVWNGTAWEDFGDYQGIEIKDGAVTTPKIANESVTRDKVALGAISSQETDFLSGGGMSRNLFDKSNVTVGYRLDTADGLTPVQDANFAYTDFIPLNPGTDLYKNHNGGVMFFNPEKEYIGALGNGTGATTHKPSGSAHFVRLNVFLSDLDTYQLEYGTEGTDYEEYGYRPVYLKSHVKVLEENIPGLEIPEFEIEDGTVTPYKTTFISGGRNLFDKDKRLVNQYWNLSGGFATLQSVTTLDTAEPISVKPGEIYHKNREGHIAFLNPEFEIVSSTNSAAPAGAYTVPNYATQMVFNVFKEDVEEYQIELGDHETEYDDGKLKLSTDIKIAPESLPSIKVVGENTPKYYKVNAAGDFTVYLPITSEEYVSYRFSRNTLENYMKLNESGIYTKVDSGFTPKFDITENSSNKEFAINVSPEDGSSGTWFPQHNNIGTVFITNDGLQEFMVDGKLVDLETPSTDYIPFDMASFSQVAYAKLPDDDGNRAKIIISYDFDHIVKQYFEIEFLKNTRINRFYSFMMPVRQDYVEKIKTNRREIVYSQETTETVNTDFSDLTANEFIATSKEIDKQNYYVRYKMTNKSHELQKLWLEHRQSRFQKLYPMITETESVLMGEKYYFDGEYEIGKLINANKVYG